MNVEYHVSCLDSENNRKRRLVCARTKLLRWELQPRLACLALYNKQTNKQVLHRWISHLTMLSCFLTIVT